MKLFSAMVCAFRGHIWSQGIYTRVCRRCCLVREAE